MTQPSIKTIEVVAGIMQDAQGRVLLGQRAANTFYPGYWEFPGGKIEPGESAKEALVRELREELDITVTDLSAWFQTSHTYPHAHVKLHFFHVHAWQGTPKAIIHSALSWQKPGNLNIHPSLPTTAPALKRLQLPTRMGITHAWQIGLDAQLRALDKALSRGLRLIQVREPGLDEVALSTFFEAAQQRASAYQAIVLYNGTTLQAQTLKAHGLHLNSQALRIAHQQGQRPDFEWVGAACHCAEDLKMAEQLALDYAVLSPVCPTLSHPGEPSLGWTQFQTLANAISLPVFALGGLNWGDLDVAQTHHAHGIGMLRGAWHVDI